jgi:hypothetical protein
MSHFHFRLRPVQCSKGLDLKDMHLSVQAALLDAASRRITGMRRQLNGHETQVVPGGED